MWQLCQDPGMIRSTLFGSDLTLNAPITYLGSCGWCIISWCSGHWLLVSELLDVFLCLWPCVPHKGGFFRPGFCGFFVCILTFKARNSQALDWPSSDLSGLGRWDRAGFACFNVTGLSIPGRLFSSPRKLLVTRASLLGTRALLLVARSY